MIADGDRTVVHFWTGGAGKLNGDGNWTGTDFSMHYCWPAKVADREGYSDRCSGNVHKASLFKLVVSPVTLTPLNGQESQLNGIPSYAINQWPVGTA
jgi:hypothetical protein